MISGTRYGLSAEINRQARLGGDVARMQTEISSGKRVLAPSDDPVASARISQIARAQADQLSWTYNVETAGALASGADSALANVAAAVDRAGELMVLARSETLSDENRATIAVELRGIAETIAGTAENKDSRGRPLFATGDPLALPIGDDLTIVPVPGRDAIFGGVPTAGGPADLVSIMTRAADAVTESDPASRRAATGSALEEVQAAAQHVAGARSDLGVRAQRIDQARERLEGSEMNLAEERSDLEDTNISELVAKLQAKKLSLEAAQSVFARINRNTLFDLIR